MAYTCNPSTWMAEDHCKIEAKPGLLNEGLSQIPPPKIKERDRVTYCTQYKYKIGLLPNVLRRTKTS